MTQLVLDWMKETDLVEVHYAKDGERVSLRVADVHAPPDVPPAVLAAVNAPAVGVFRAAAPGRSGAAVEGAAVKQGDELGLVEAGGKRTPVKATAKGRLVRVLVSDGMAVEYGRPLFIIEPG